MTSAPEGTAVPGETGSEALAAITDVASATGNPSIAGLLTTARWSGAITYAFPSSAAAYETGIREATNGFVSVSFAQMQAARSVLEGRSPYSGGPLMGMTSFEQVTGASVSEVAPGAAMIRIGASASGNPTAYAYYPSSDPRGGDVWFGTAHDYTRARLGTYDYATTLHEIGHALGLKHPHSVSGAGSVTLLADRDALEFTVMSYRSYVGQILSGGYRNETYGFPQTYMMLDIAALQTLYGANFVTHAGDTVYRWSSSTGETFINGVGQGAVGAANRVFLTIWDGGGRDTYDLSNYTTDLQVDLAPGGWSVLSSLQLAGLGDGHRARGNVFNALLYQGDTRSIIENAIGGAGHDLITGNAADNILAGGAGRDTLIGGTGTDTAVLPGMRSSYSVTPVADGSARIREVWAGSSAETDELRGVELVRFLDGTFALSSLLLVADRAPAFSPLNYIASHPDLMAALGANRTAGFEHFVRIGRAEGRSITFNGLEYTASYDDLRKAFGVNGDAGAEHFIRLGRFEGRSESFDGLQYIASYRDLMVALGADSDAGSAHFIAHGHLEGRVTTFNPAHYLSKYHDLRAAFGSDAELATHHFILHGFNEGRTDTVL